MIDCIFKEIDGIFHCINCGFETKIPKLHIGCASERPVHQAEPPTLLKRAVNFGKAAAKHVTTGMKHCENEQKQLRFEICKSNQCGLFKEHGGGGICAHDDCGCFIRSNGQFMDKLSWADSKCPVGLWGPIEGKSPENPENGV